MVLWLLAGMGQNCVNLPTQTLIADHIPTDAQGRVYGAHFAWSHLWWVISYPLAGWLGSQFASLEFFYGGLIGLALLVAVQITFAPHSHEHLHYPVVHEHKHVHDKHHTHVHDEAISLGKFHTHSHEHTMIVCHNHSHHHDVHHRHSH